MAGAAAGCAGNEDHSGPSTSAGITSPAADYSDEDALVRSALGAAVDAGLAPGGVALVRRGQHIEVYADGVADRATHAAMRPRTRFRIASVSKPMLAAVVLQLASEGALSLDDTVESWLPGFVPGGDAVTVEQLLSHTSGLFDFAMLPGSRRAYFDGADSVALVRDALEHPPTFAPGAGAAYSNTGYVLLGLIVEKATGTTLEANLETRIFRPLGMTASTATNSGAMDPPIAHGYEGGRDVTQADLSAVWGAGTVVSTARDVATFFTALLDNRVIPADMVEQMKTNRTGPLLGATPIGLGLAQTDVGCGTAYGHDGDIFGYLTQAWASADNDRQVVILFNTDDGDFSILGSTFDTIFKAARCAR